MAVWGVDARADSIPYHQYTSHDGLPSKRITALAQTNDGLLWVGTLDGLVVYDGHEFRAVPLPDSVRSTVVNTLEPMPDGTVWVGVGNDAVKVRPDGAVRHHRLDSHTVVDVLRRGRQLLFVTQLAVWRQHSNRDTLARTPFRYERLKDVTQVRGVDLGPQGDLWIANGERGVGRVRPDGGVDFTDPPQPVSSDSQPSEPFFDLRFCADGTALVARSEHLYRFDPATNTFSLLDDAVGPIEEIYRRGRTVYLIRTSSVLRYDTQARRFREPLGNLPDLPNVTTTEALRGRDGGVWVGTQNAGLLHFPTPNVRHVTSIDGQPLRYGAGFYQMGTALWANTWGDGLFQLRPRRRHVTPDGHTRWVFLRSHDGRLHGLTPSRATRGREWYRWAPTTGWEYVGLAAFAVRGYVDSSGVGYFWHNQGLYRHVPVGDTTERTRLRAWSLDESQHHLMGPAPNGDLLLFDQGTVLRLRRPDGAVIDTVATAPAYAEAGGRRLQIDKQGRIWSPFNDLLRIDPAQGTTQALLEGAAVENVQMAGDSLAMAKTNEGLYLLNAHTGAVRRHLTEADGLLSNDVNGAHLTDDTLYVGHQSGLTLVPADSLFRVPRTPHAVLTGLEINLDARSLPPDSVFGQEERDVGFAYTGASLVYPDRVRYEVRLVPRDTSWKTTARRFVRYTNLAPDTYRFEVRARLEGRASGPVAAYTFTIPPHFYETGWFRLLVVLAGLGLGVGGYRWRTYRLRKRQEELEEAVDERTQELVEEKKKTERQAERLAELDEAKNRFFAHISHEFRTPLSLILGPLRDVLQRASEGTATVSVNQLRRMVGNAERLQRLIDQLLDLATLEAGRMELDRRPGDLASVVERSAEAFRSKAEQKGLSLQIWAPEGRIETRFDPEKVETIVSNLVSNAVKFTSDGGTVTVRVRRKHNTELVEAPGTNETAAGAVRIEVDDTGPGIDPLAQERIFDRFEHVDSSTTREHEGTGLGLALTNELVALHGGTIEVESTPDEGATFIVQLPLVPVADSGNGRMGEGARGRRGEAVGDGIGEGREGPGEEAGTGEQSRGGEATILIVEDNAEMRAYLREQLSGAWAVMEAVDGEEGWKRVQDAEPDLVLSDVMMPKLDGFELCRRIKDDEALRTTPVLLLTARAGEEATREGLRCGADDYVAKPFDAEELRQRIENHLAARRHLQARYREEVDVGGVIVGEAHRSFIERLIGVIDQQLGNPDLTVGDLATEMALSRRQFTRRVKDATGEPPGTFLRRRRIEQAQAMLEREPETIAEVAYAVGFQSPSAFSQSFREHVGSSPSTYVEDQSS
jgi:signal transduction histidine kinase/DNA-binding response OmpR family regulator